MFIQTQGFSIFIILERAEAPQPPSPQKHKLWLRPDMTEKLFTGTVSLNTTNTTKRFAIIIEPHYE